MKKSIIVGMDRSKEFTRRRILGIDVIVLKGRRILITLKAETLEDVMTLLIQLIITTMKSIYIKGVLLNMTFEH